MFNSHQNLLKTILVKLVHNIVNKLNFRHYCYKLLFFYSCSYVMNYLCIVWHKFVQLYFYRLFSVTGKFYF